VSRIALRLKPVNPKLSKSTRLLQRSIKLARKLERIASNSAAVRPLTLVGYGFLVRNRRLASAIVGVRSEYLYESLILLRTMLEIFVYYSWIRLKNRHSRAIRFLRYEPIDGLKCVETMPTAFSPLKFAEIKKRLRRERSRTRHLFRIPDKKTGKRHWARSWATVSSIEGRLHEVRSSVPPPAVGNYLYGVYRWISSIVHGGPQSLGTVLTSSGSLRAVAQPLNDQGMPIRVAFVLLVSTIDLFAVDMGVASALDPELSRLKKHLKGSIPPN
jgi:hypothetical protein